MTPVRNVAPAIAATGLGVRIKRTPLLNNVDLTVAHGEWVSIIGPNGAGKSTLLRALMGALKSSGSVRLHGQNLDDLDARARARLVSWVPQTPVMPAGVAVLDYVLLGRTPHVHPLSREKPADIEVARNVIDELDLGRLAGRAVDSLSGGERQRAMIARALTQESPIILLDEPTSALDLGHQQEVLTLLDRLRSNGDRTIVSTMHDLTLAGVFTDRLVMLACGELVAEGPASHVLTEANLEQYYGAKVRVTQQDGRVVVTPRVDLGHRTQPTGDTMATR